MSGMCSTPDCSSPVLAKGLCAKHYMRQRRTGDPATTRKPGRPLDRVTQVMRALHLDYSPRTVARYRKAMHLLDRFDDGSKKRVLVAATRPNGTINVSRLLDLALLVSQQEKTDDAD